VRLLLVCLFASLPVSLLAAPPNVVVIVADDLGWNDVGYHNPEIRTPHIDALAEQGARFDRFYVNPTCSPTRASLMTGKFAARVGMDAPVQWHTEQGLPLEERILPEYFRDAGYQTLMSGKWHLGMAHPDMFPGSRGFDHSYGNLAGGIGYYDHVFSGGLDWHRDGEVLREEGYATDLIAAEAVRLLRARDRTRPTFLYLSFTAPHTPLEAPDAVIRSYAHVADPKRRTLAAMITTLDAAIGRVLAVLDEQGMADDTLVFFLSDNGGQLPAGMLIEFMVPPARDGVADNAPLRGGKGRVYEGGVRVPAVIRWPGRIEPGRTIVQPIFVADLLPTLLAATGFPLDAREAADLDGESQLDGLLERDLRPRSAFVVANLGSEAMIDWPWKLVAEASLPFIPDFLKSTSYSLFHLDRDPEEQQDVAQQHPARVAKMKAWLAAQPRREWVVLDLSKGSDSFGGELTREPWVERARSRAAGGESPPATVD